MKSSAESPDLLGNPVWAPWLAGALPCLLYALTAAGHSYWLDSGEFSAAAIDLDIAHPPGHPLTALWGKAFSLLPLGPLPYRVALAQGLAAALGAGALQLSFARTLHMLQIPASCGRCLLSIAASWIVAFSFGYWFQAVRAEVYALQAMLICLALERLLALAADPELHDVRPLYLASFYLGLGLANHHFMAVLAMPALLHGLWRAARAHGLRAVGFTLGTGAAGLTTYLYLPLRAASEPSMDLGHPLAWRDFWWVVSARVYARRIGSEATQPMGERFLDLLVILVEQFSYLGLPLALLGSYLVLRKRALWPLGAVWGVTAIVTLCGRAWLNPVRANPDVLGYMLPGFAGYVALAVCGGTALLMVLPPTLLRRGVLSMGVLALGLSAAQLLSTRAQASLSSFRATDEFDQLRYTALPPDALVLLTNPETTFRHWDAQACTRLRGDVDMLPLPFLNYGATADVLLRRLPELSDLVRAYQSTDRLQVTQVHALLSARRPLLVEADLLATWPLFERLLPDGLLYRVLAAPPSAAQRAAAARARDAILQGLYARLGAQIEQTETRRQLLWIHYMDALYYAVQQEPALGLAAVQHGLRLQPLERELLRLKKTLMEAPERFDLRTFLPGAR